MQYQEILSKQSEPNMEEDRSFSTWFITMRQIVLYTASGKVILLSN